MSKQAIVVRGAREHNLKNIHVTIPRDQLVVITGLSGSGKSSLAFDTLYAEGQRRYVESLSAYARQFLGQMEKPDVDSIEGLSPAISIDQKTTSKNPRSTVGTITEVYDYLRVLFANLGVPHCPKDGTPIQAQTAEQIVERILGFADGTKLQVLAPVIKDRKGEYVKLFKDLKQQGFERVRVNGTLGTVEDDWKLARYEKHSIDVVVDRLVLKEGHADDKDLRQRLTDAVEQALKMGEGQLHVLTSGAAADGATQAEETDHVFSEHFSCTECGFSMPDLAPRTFSFNSPHGACPTCLGLGFSLEVDPDVLIVDPDASLSDGALHGTVKRASPWIVYEIEQLARAYKFKMATPWKDLPQSARDIILFGADRRIKTRYELSTGRVWEGYEQFEGIVPRLQRYYKETDSDNKRERIQSLMASKPCRDCKGSRLKPEVLAVRVAPDGKEKGAADGVNLADVVGMPVGRAYAWFLNYESQLSDRERHIAHEVVKEIRERLRFMIDVGLDYLTLDRSAATLSGGEGQRIRLATQIGSGLVGVLYILDEPSIGLHQRDNHRLIESLKGLRELGNTLLVVEHDEDMIRAADWVLDLGPGAGEHGGDIIAQGTPSQIEKNKKSVTGAYLSGRRAIDVPTTRREGNGKKLVIRGARENNLKDIDVELPLGKFLCVTGVSGSGKSTLINDVLYKALARKFYGAAEAPGKHRKIEGLEHIDKVIIIDQTPIGRTPRSNPATYTGLFTGIRDLFAATADARSRGFQKGRFSFNVKGGRCEACQGDGMVKIEMHFLADVFVNCDVCKGARYNKETLQVKYKGKSIKDVLDMTIEEAHAFFEPIPSLRRPLATLLDVGLSYMRLGQSATTLSGGEAQRIKLATELQKRATGKTLYILDEPTTGLHFADIEKLLGVLNRLADTGNTVLVIEHNLDVIKHADWLVDLGPDGGEKGGTLLAEGTPEEVAANPASYTGQYLKPLLARAAAAGSSGATPAAATAAPKPRAKRGRPKKAAGAKPAGKSAPKAAAKAPRARKR